MSSYEDDWYPSELDGPEWRPLPPSDCQNCECCTARLCAQGRANPFGCEIMAQMADKARVQGCPCSAEATPGTAAYGAAQVRTKLRAERDGGSDA